MGVKKSLILTILILLILSVIILPKVNAGILDFIKKTITGKASSRPTNITITISGTNPAKITYVSPISAVDPTEATYKSVTFYITAYDEDGVADLNDSSFRAEFNNSNEPRRSGSCTLVNDINAKSANYSCTVNMWYWDKSGVWTINASGTDLGNKSIATNTSTTFTYNQLKAMVISPTTLTWPAISPNSTNQTSDNDPTLINNTGNYNGTIDVTAINLLGESDPLYIIYAANFTVGLTTGAQNPECAGQALANNTLVTITNSISNRGNLSAGGGAGQEEFYYCIPRVPSNLSSQTYSTTLGGSWTIGY